MLIQKSCEKFFPCGSPLASSAALLTIFRTQYATLIKLLQRAPAPLQQLLAKPPQGLTSSQLLQHQRHPHHTKVLPTHQQTYQTNSFKLTEYSSAISRRYFLCTLARAMHVCTDDFTSSRTSLSTPALANTPSTSATTP